MSCASESTDLPSRKVDRTKPSTACEPCRKRRAKCDRKRPSCSQCLRTSRKCEGYRQAFDLVLRNKSDDIAKQYSVKSTHATRKSEEPVPCEHIQTDGTKSNAPQAFTPLDCGLHKLTLTRCPSQSMAAFSTAVFTKAFEDSAYLDYVPDLLLSPERSPILDTCFEAVSLLYCAQYTSRYSLLHPKAREAYHKAIPQVQKAISGTDKLSSDELLASIMLLALYTLLSPDVEGNLEMWALHFQGAIAVLCQRSLSSLQGKALQNLLSHMLSFGAMHAFQTWQPMSPDLLSCLKYSLQMQHPIQIRFWQILMAVTDLQYKIKSSECLEPDTINQLRATDEQVKAYYLFCTLGREEDDIWQEHGHENDYPIRRKMQPLNNLRVARIRLNELIHVHAMHCIECGKYGFGEDETSAETQAFRASQVVEMMAEEICHSIPEMFRPGHQANEYPDTLNAWIFSLVWPLLEVVDASLVSQRLRSSAASQLRWFSKISGNGTVTKMAPELAEDGRGSASAHILYLC